MEDAAIRLSFARELVPRQPELHRETLERGVRKMKRRRKEEGKEEEVKKRRRRRRKKRRRRRNKQLYLVLGTRPRALRLLGH